MIDIEAEQIVQQFTSLSEADIEATGIYLLLDEGDRDESSALKLLRVPSRSEAQIWLKERIAKEFQQNRRGLAYKKHELYQHQRRTEVQVAPLSVHPYLQTSMTELADALDTNAQEIPVATDSTHRQTVATIIAGRLVDSGLICLIRIKRPQFELKKGWLSVIFNPNGAAKDVVKQESRLTIDEQFDFITFKDHLIFLSSPDVLDRLGPSTKPTLKKAERQLLTELAKYVDDVEAFENLARDENIIPKLASGLSRWNDVDAALYHLKEVQRKFPKLNLLTPDGKIHFDSKVRWRLVKALDEDYLASISDPSRLFEANSKRGYEES